MLDKIRTVTVHAMPMTTVIERFRGFFGCWADFECPARPVEAIMAISVKKKQTPFEKTVDLLICLAR